MTFSQNKLSDEFLKYLEQNKGILYKVARSYGNNEDEIKDLIQEISIQVWKAFPKYKQEFKFSTWLYRIALNVAISNYRKEKVRAQINSPMEDQFIQIAAPKESTQNENIKQLYLLISEFKHFDRALMLLYLDEKSYAEIANIMGISESNVATKLSRLKKKLKEKFLK
tara:strand:+ start:323 stop:826 length:504 start_codon:yes stop_codon:yes gene_type:complete